MAATTKLSEKFQIAIPRAVREAHAWRAGQSFAFISKGKGVLLMPVPEIRDLFGIAAGANTANIRDRDDRY